MKLLVAICVLVLGTNAQVGPAGIVDPSGRNIQFSHDFANNIAVFGPSGIVTKNGQNLQLTAEQAKLYSGFVPVPPTHVHNFVSHHANPAVGPAGIVKPDGNNVQFSHDFANNIVLIGPSGIVTRNGQNMQLRKKRSANPKTITGSSGLILPNGQQVQFTEAGVYILLEGPSGILLSNGQLVQKRAKRSIDTFGAVVGASGLISPKGVSYQFPAGVTVAAAGPSGAVLSNGQHIQYRLKRSIDSNWGALVGASGFITPAGVPIQLEAGVTVVSAGPSGAVLSNGRNIQY